MSPIKGITDSVLPAFPRIGRLRKGAEAKRNAAGQVVQMGADLTVFRFTSERPEVESAFEDAYGEKPALIRAYLPYASTEDNFSCWKEKWSAGGLVHRCDGETINLWLGPDGKYRHDAKPCDGGCDEVGRLSLIVPELVKAGFVGYVTMETHGINDLLSIQASLLAAAQARVGNPLGLRGIQWVLRRVKEKVSTPVGNGKRARRDKWLVKLEPAADWVQLQLQAAHNATMMLPAGRSIDAEEAAGFVEAEGEVIDGKTGEIVSGRRPVPRADVEDDGLPFDESDRPEASEPEATAPPSPEPWEAEIAGWNVSQVREQWNKLADKAAVLGVEPPNAQGHKVGEVKALYRELRHIVRQAEQAQGQ